MDSIDHFTCFIGTKSDGQTPRVFIKPGGHYKVELVCKGGTAKMARPPFSRSFNATWEDCTGGSYFKKG